MLEKYIIEFGFVLGDLGDSLKKGKPSSELDAVRELGVLINNPYLEERMTPVSQSVEF